MGRRAAAALPDFFFISPMDLLIAPEKSSCPVEKQTCDCLRGGKGGAISKQQSNGDEAAGFLVPSLLKHRPGSTYQNSAVICRLDRESRGALHIARRTSSHNAECRGARAPTGGGPAVLCGPSAKAAPFPISKMQMRRPQLGRVWVGRWGGLSKVRRARGCISKGPKAGNRQVARNPASTSALA